MRMVGETQWGERQSQKSTTTVITPQRVCLGQLIMHEVVAVQMYAHIPVPVTPTEGTLVHHIIHHWSSGVARANAEGYSRCTLYNYHLMLTRLTFHSSSRLFQKIIRRKSSHIYGAAGINTRSSIYAHISNTIPNNAEPHSCPMAVALLFGLINI